MSGRRAYVVVRPGGSITAPSGLRLAMLRVRRLGRRLGPRWRIRPAHGEPTPWNDDLRRVLATLRDALEDARDRRPWVLEGEHDAAVVRVRVVELAPPVKATEGNARIDAIYTWVVGRFPGRIRSAGICVRKYIAGTSSWSQHSPWPPPDPGANAWDWFAPSFPELVHQAQELVEAAKRGEVPVGRVIVGDRTWTPSEGWADYGGQYHYHVHAEGLPKRGPVPLTSCG
jgi:hypothetical protein